MLSAVILASALVTTPNLGASIAPAAVTTASANSQATYLIGDAGTVPEHIVIQVVTMQPVKDKPGEYVPLGEYSHYQVDHPEFTLTPMSHRMITVTVQNPSGYGQHLGVVAEASVTGSGMARVHAEVVSKFTVTGPAQPQAAVAVPTPKPASHFPLLPVGGGILVLCAAILSGLGVILRRRARA